MKGRKYDKIQLAVNNQAARHFRQVLASFLSPRDEGQRKTLLGDCHPPPPRLSSTCSPCSMGVSCLHVSSWYTNLGRPQTEGGGGGALVKHGGRVEDGGGQQSVYAVSSTCQRRASGRPRGGTPCRRRSSRRTSPPWSPRLGG